MANQPNPNKRHITLRVNVDVCRKVENKYHHKDDSSAGVAFIRALEDSVREVELTEEDLNAIAKEVSMNKAKISGRL